MKNLDLTKFDFDVPKQLIAQVPLGHRDHSRLMHVNRHPFRVMHQTFFDLPDLLPPNCVLVLNNTKVIKARVLAQKKTGGMVECFFLNRLKSNTWDVLLKNGRNINPKDTLVVNGHCLNILSKTGNQAVVSIVGEKSDHDFLNQVGQTPLPPYIKSKEPLDHASRYQTIFASEPGAVAAPTASLHFTSDIFTQLSQKKIDTIFITHHIGLGTFNPIKTNNIYDHTMHKETYVISKEAASKLNQAKTQKKMVIAVGTTVARCLESNVVNGQFSHGKKDTGLYITPGHSFNGIDGLVTNFHLPKSSLFIMISAFLGRDKAHDLYQLAMDHDYRFFSYGDAMLIT